MATFEEAVKIRHQAEMKDGKSRMEGTMDHWVGPWEEAYKKLGRHKEFLDKMHWIASRHPNESYGDKEWQRKVNLILAEFWINYDLAFP